MLLEVKNLKKHFPIRKGVFARTVAHLKAVDDVSFSVDKNEVMGLVGESGCGKTTVGRCILRLYEPTSGQVSFEGRNLLALKGNELKDARKRLQVVFQDPMSSLNPRMTIGNILSEPFVIHKTATGQDLKNKVFSLLDKVGLPKGAINRYPHEFSGGQKQRVGIARALALNPALIIADEPVSALDVSIQAQIINLLMDLKKEFGLAFVFIAHNLAVVKHISDRIAVMYLGKIVEEGPAKEICDNPQHPYTRALLEAVPVPEVNPGKKRAVLTGDVPSPVNPPSGCAFHTRCPIAKEECKSMTPVLESKGNRKVACPFV